MRPLLAGLLAEIQDDDIAKRELAEALLPYMAQRSDESSDRLLNAMEKAAQLRVHPETLVRMARAGRIRAVKVGREWRFRVEDLPGPRRFAASGRAVNTSTPRRRSIEPASVAAIRGQ